MGMEAHLECAPEPNGVRAARLFVVDKLQEWQCDDLVESAALITSELATNAVLHTRQPFSVGVHRHGSGIRVEVCDASTELPTLIPDRDGDRVVDLTAGDVLAQRSNDVDHLFSGLGMVDAVATDWGTQPIPGHGKVVWFELLSNLGGNGGLGALRRMSDPAAAEANLERTLPPLEPQGLDDVHYWTAPRMVVAVLLVALAGAVVYAALWAGGVTGAVWYGH